MVVMVRVADSNAGGFTVGVNVTAIVQVEFPARVPRHGSLDTTKSPPRIALLYVTGALPVLESVTVWGRLVVLSATIPKFRAEGDTETDDPPMDTVLDHAEVTTPFDQ